jgi:hypothetical protein
MSKLLENITAARRAGVPLVAVVSHDQPATVAGVAAGVNGCPKVAWDCINGLRAIDEAGQEALDTLSAEVLNRTPRPVFAFQAALELPPKTIVFCYNGNASNIITDPGGIQAIQNLREAFKGDKRMLILLGDTFAQMTPGLRADIVTLTEPVPSESELSDLITELHEAARKPLPEPELPKMVNAIKGLPALFTAEQVVAMSFRKDGLDMDALWERKRDSINATKGLSISKPKMRYADLAGMDAIMGYLRRYQSGPRPARAILMWDEIEKMMGGTGDENAHAVSADQLNVVLKKMETLHWAGIILFGIPGSGKTALIDATAGEFDLEKVEMDFGGFKEQWVGSSEHNIRTGFDMMESLGGEDVLVMATCNRMKSLPPEFRRRFFLGNWFFALPMLDEQEPIKRIHEKAFGVQGQDWPDTEGWTGAEIRNCAMLANRLQCSLVEAAPFIVPISKADPESLDDLMDLANDRFLSVSKPGTWKKSKATMNMIKAKRRIDG